MTTIPSIGSSPPGALPPSSGSPIRNSAEARPTAQANPAGGVLPSESVKITQADNPSEPVASPQTQTAQKQPDREAVERAMQEVKKAVDPMARNLQFSIDEDTGRTIVRIVDTATKEVIRQIPSEEVLAIAKALDRMDGEKKASGVFLKQKA
ncbi:flagellar protein FlaG [Niveibacterium microcysteis]|uniref:Flagellar protein FlaG n=1 Tax=Niveibacterium microcysteis TaxID=2811415 RepID=A0ABX7M1L4_9RHOO|nr:flagellar protein FlaG [Niveibacterium microcysteis]QSI75311.1 flagellar protein FlaG [Niveibacterium microcysteis]